MSERSESASQLQNPDPINLENQKAAISYSKDRIDVENQRQEEEDVGAGKNEGGEQKGEGGGEDDEEEGECGFCLFMKGGGCKDTFTAWEKCVEEADMNEEDVVEKCFEVTSNLKKCMEAHSDYYEPILRAEKKAEEEAVNQLEQEKKAQEQGSEQSDGSESSKQEDDKKEN